MNQLVNGPGLTPPPNGVSSSKGTGGKKTQRTELSPRQTEIVRWVAQGLSDREIGNKLALTEETVGWHLKNIFLKRGVHARAALVAHFLQEISPMRPVAPPTNVRVAATASL